VRVFRFTVASAVGLVVGTALALVAAVVVVVLVVLDFSTSESEHAKHEVQPQFGEVAHVDSCRKVSDDSADQSEYRCDVTATRCTRSYLFAVAHEFGGYAATPAAKSEKIFSRPCSVPSDR
jgi:hypothetical protein